MVLEGARPHDGPMTTETAPLPPFPDTRRRIRRSSTDRHLGGVAGGVGTYLGIDPLVVRIAFVIIGVLSLGLALSAYAAAWLLLGDEVEAEGPGLRWFREHGSDAGAIATLVVLVALSAIVIGSLNAVVHDGSADALPFAIGAGVVAYVVLQRRRTGATPADQTTTSLAATVAAPPDPATLARRSRHRAVRNTTVLAAAIVGAVSSTLWLSGAWDVAAWVVPALVLGVLTVGLALSPWSGWSWTLAALAVLTTPVLLFTLVPGATARGGVGTRSAHPVTVAEIAPIYRLGAGEQTVDLRDLVLEPATSATVRVAVGVGATEVLVPADAEVHVQGHLSAGTVLLDGNDVDIEGTDVRVDRVFPALTTTEQPATVRVLLDVGVGAADIRRMG